MKRVPKPLLVLAAGLLLALQAGSGYPQTAGSASPATGQGAGQGLSQANGQPDQITLNFQDVDIRALINTVSEVTGKNFIVDPRVKGQVTLVSGTP
ncbi:MAG: hypothetical protein WAL83_07360, partial [Arenicellales bacterium]